MAKRSPAASTMSAETMASVSGILMVKVVLCAGRRFQIDRAADLLDIAAHDVHADAAAGNAGHFAAVEKPGAKMKLQISASDLAARSASLASPSSIALALMRAVSRPRPSSAISMMMWPP